MTANDVEPMMLSRQDPCIRLMLDQGYGFGAAFAL